MHFCNNCENMFYLKIENENCDKLLYYCRNCGNTDVNLINTSKCILKETFNNESKEINQINKYTKLDITLPRINYIKCPNESCKSNTDDFDINNREILYIRYNNINMKYLYLCCHCEYYWNTEK
jgi:DNA-directed RNA polymerase subunit M/transcription elongation factor TFIIS